MIASQFSQKQFENKYLIINQNKIRSALFLNQSWIEGTFFSAETTHDNRIHGNGVNHNALH
jgi:hypothetical protein